MPINIPQPSSPEAIIRHRLRCHGFSNAHAVLIMRAIMHAKACPHFEAEVGTFGLELLDEAIQAFKLEG